VNDELRRQRMNERYDIMTYETGVQQANAEDLRNAMDLQTKGNELAQKGRQYEARQALESAYNYSLADPALNEDTRVQLRKLIRQQAVVGLVGRRDQIRLQTGEQQAGPGGQDLGDRFNQAEAERLENSLSQDDSGNLKRIADRLIDNQDKAAGTALQLIVNTPLKGRMLEFTRPLQVKPNSAMVVTFSAKQITEPQTKRNWLFVAGLVAGLWVVLSVCARVKAKRLAARPAAPKPIPPEPEAPEAPAQADADVQPAENPPVDSDNDHRDAVDDGSDASRSDEADAEDEFEAGTEDEPDGDEEEDEQGPDEDDRQN